MIIHDNIALSNNNSCKRFFLPSFQYFSTIHPQLQNKARGYISIPNVDNLFLFPHSILIKYSNSFIFNVLEPVENLCITSVIPEQRVTSDPGCQVSTMSERKTVQS